MESIYFAGANVAKRAERSLPQLMTRVSPVLLVVFMTFFFVVTSWLSLTRHDLFNSTGFDLAIQEQIVWNTLNGRFFASSVEVNNSFADHFRPMLLALVPVYAVFQTPKTLLIIQSLVLASAAIPIYLLAKLKLEYDYLALAMGSVYLLYPALGYVARFDFHVEIFVIPAFITAFYMMERGRWNAASLFLIVPLLCKENMGLMVLAFGVYGMLRWKKYKWGLAWIFVGLAYTWFTIFWLIPTVRGETVDTLSRYAWLGDSTLDKLQTIIFEPALWFNHLFTQSNLTYALQLFLPVGFLSLFGFRELLLAVPALAINLLAEHFCQSTIYCHYSAPIIPIIFISAICGLAWLKETLVGEKSGVLFIGPVVLVVISYWIWHPFQEVSILPSAFEPVGNAEVVKQALQAVPADGSLSLVTTNDYAPHLAQREGLYIVGIPTQRVAPTDPDIVFLNLYDQQYIVCDQIRDYVIQLDRDAYGTTFRTGGLIVLQRNAGSPETFIDFVDNWNNCAG